MNISIVIPVKNEGRHIRQCVAGWLGQTVPVHEIIVIDSGSTDDTLSILAEFPQVIVVEIAGLDFNHGTTRNLGVSKTSGELILMTVGDARPLDDQVLERMQACFKNDSIAGVCGSQVVPHDMDKNPVEWFRPYSQPTISEYSFPTEGEYDVLEPDKKHSVTGWDDVIAMYHGDILRNEIPFREITYGEDAQWAQEAYRAGKTLVFCPAARVYHYHLENAEVTFKRAITMYYLRYRMFGVEPTRPPMVQPIASAVKRLLKEKGLSLSDRIKWLSHNIGNRFAMRRAYRRFRSAMKGGHQQVEALHQEFTGKQFKVASK
jgi:rhamnosyltransferase